MRLGRANLIPAGCALAALLAVCGCTMEDPGVTGSDDQPGAATQLVPAGGPRTDPALTVRTNVLGDYLFPAPPYATEPIFQRDHLVFDWSAVPDYGDTIAGYSHAYDDTSSWTPWSLDDRHFEITPTLGEHSLFVRAMDDSGHVTLGRIPIETVETALDSYILVVDDFTTWEATIPALGTDAMRDAFYDTLLFGYEHPAVDYDAQSGPPGVSELARASTVVWEADSSAPGLRGMFGSGESRYDVFGGYLRVGGNLVLCGMWVLGQILDEMYPVDISTSDTTRASVFVRDCLGISGVQNTLGGLNLPNYGCCFYGAEPAATLPAAHGEFEPMYLDTLGKWSYYYNYHGGPSSPPWHAGLPYVDLPWPSHSGELEAFTMKSYLNFFYRDRTCCVISLSGSTGGNTCFFGFPLYYIKTPQVMAVMDELLATFGEVKDHGTGVPGD